MSYLKTVGNSELVAHRLVSTEVPYATADILQAHAQDSDDRLNSSWIVELEDLAKRRCDPFVADTMAGHGYAVAAGRGKNFELLRDALIPLARIHSNFEGRGAELLSLGVNRFQDLSVRELSGHLLRRRNTELHLGLTDQEFDELVALDKRAVGIHDQLVASSPHFTLCHGDLHLSNMFRVRDGYVALLDWGEACVAPAAWDLVACPVDLLDYYLSLRGPSIETDSFLESLQAVTMLRLREFCRTLILSDIQDFPTQYGQSTRKVLDRLLSVLRAGL